MGSVVVAHGLSSPVGLIPGLERFPGVGQGNPSQYYCLENPMDKESGGLQSMGSERVRHD